MFGAPGMLAALGSTAGASGGLGSLFGALGGAQGIGSLVGGLGGLFGGNSANEAKKKWKKQVKNTYAKAQGFSDYSFAQQQQLLNANLTGVGTAYDKAVAQAGFGAQQGKQGVIDQGKVSLGSALSGLESSGLGGSTLAANAKLGIGAQTSKALADIDAVTSQILGGLAVNKQQATAGANIALANLASNKAAMNQALLFGKMGQLQGVAGPGQVPEWMYGPPQMEGVDWGSIGQMIGSVNWGGG